MYATVVAAYSIRHRILKVLHLPARAGLRQRCSLFDPTQDTERRPELHSPMQLASCSLFDPTQDTERSHHKRQSRWHTKVAAYSIRHRILKAAHRMHHQDRARSCSLFDPTQDTESLPPYFIIDYPSPVAAYSIRHRILKDRVCHHIQSGHELLQPIRSDTGY